MIVANHNSYSDNSYSDNSNSSSGSSNLGLFVENTYNETFINSKVVVDR